MPNRSEQFLYFSYFIELEINQICVMMGCNANSSTVCSTHYAILLKNPDIALKYYNTC